MSLRVRVFMRCDMCNKRGGVVHELYCDYCKVHTGWELCRSCISKCKENPDKCQCEIADGFYLTDPRNLLYKDYPHIDIRIDNVRYEKTRWK